MAVDLWSKSGSSSTVVSTGGVPATGTTPVIVSNPMTSGNAIYVPAGGTVTTVGNYQIITFTGTGSFTVNQTGNVELMLIGGGGGGSNQLGSAHAGASSGGMIYYGSNLWRFRSGTSITLVAGTTYTITIGAGGALGQPTNITTLTTAMGGNTSIVGGSISLTAYGGSSLCGDYNAGGAGSRYYNKTTAQESSYQLAAPNQGYSGGTKSGRQDYHFLGAGGGGTGEGGGHGYGGGNAGYDTLVYNSGWGGNGFLTDISGTTAYYGGGGGGGQFSYNGISNGSPGQRGGLGGGGNGGYLTAVSYPGVTGGAGTDGTPNTGGGGGGACYSYGTGYSGGFAGGQGGSGVLILKVPLYNIDTAAITVAQSNLIALGNTATGGTVTYSGNYRIHTFTGSGTFTAAHTGFIEYLCIAGGGAGGNGYYNTSNFSAGGYGGGGGAGGYLEHFESSTLGGDFQGQRIYVNAGDSLTIVVGAGGAALGVVNSTPATLGEAVHLAMDGNNSYIRNNSNKTEIVAYGGGGGANYNDSAADVESNGFGGWHAGRAGGSGGGAAKGFGSLGVGTNIYASGPGGACLNAVNGTRQGYMGKYSLGPIKAPTNLLVQVPPYYGGGAGTEGNVGGLPRYSTVTGSNVAYSQGGAISYFNSVNYTNPAGTPNVGNGGNGGTQSGATSGSTTRLGSSGGSGIVIIRYRFQ